MLTSEVQAAELLKLLGHKTRLGIILEIGTGEACVCHLVHFTGERQAYISQQLMVMRDAGILKTRKEGRYVFYALSSPQILDLVKLTDSLIDIPDSIPGKDLQIDPCPCPRCQSK